MFVVVAVQSASHAWLFETPRTAAHQVTLVLTISQSLPKFMLAYWMPSDLGDSSFVVISFWLLYSSWGSHSKYIGVVCHWITVLSWWRGLCNSLKIRAIPDGRVIAESSDKTWSTGGGNLMLSPANIASPIHINFKLQTFKDVNMCLCLQSCKLVHVSGVYCHEHASSASGCASAYFVVQYCIGYSFFIASPVHLEASIKAKVYSWLSWGT